MNNFITRVQQVSRWLQAQPKMAAVLLSVIFGSIAFVLQIDTGFPDPDAYYHAKMTEFLASGILLTEFIWLPDTLLATVYTDHHFLYHVLLAPLAILFDGLVAVKVSIVFFAALLPVFYFWIMRRFAIAGAWWWTLFVFLSAPMILRLNVAKALPLALAIVLMGVLALHEKRPWLLFGLSFLFVWTYAGWPLLTAITLGYGVMLTVQHRRLTREASALIAAAVLGSFLGVVINPYFPNNLLFYWAQIVEIALTPTTQYGVGSEWLPFALPALFAFSPHFFIVAFVVMVVGVTYRLTAVKDEARIDTDQSMRLLLTALTGGLFIMTLMAGRYVEYLVPIGTLALALWVKHLYQRGAFLPYQQTMQQLYRTWPKFFFIAFSIFLFIAVAYVGRAALLFRATFVAAPPLRYLENGAQAMRAQLPPGELIFNINWGEFPELFYFNDAQRYVWGIDPRFSGKAFLSLAELRQRLLLGEEEDPAGALAALGSRYLLVSSRDDQTRVLHTSLLQKQLIVRYQDHEVVIYERPN